MKGQTLSVLSLVSIFFMVTGNMFGATIAQQEIKESISYSANDANQLLRAELKADTYSSNIKKEINYTHNNIAYALSPDWEELSWDNNIPSDEDIRSSFKEEMRTGEYGIIQQNRLWGCSKPELEENPLEILNPNEIKLKMKKAAISCSGNMATAIIPIQEEYTVENPENNYLHLTGYAQTLAQKVNDIAPEHLEKSGSESTDSCESPDKSETKREARVNARDNTVTGEEDIAEEAYEDTSDSRSSFISGEYDTILTGSFSQTDSSESQCTYDCECEEEDETDCECQGTEYSYTYNYTVEKISADFELTDSEHEVITHDGEKQLSFDFKYSKDLQ